MTRQAAIARAEAHFYSGAFWVDLARRVGMATESQNAARAQMLAEYLYAEMTPAFEALGFVCRKLTEQVGPSSSPNARRTPRGPRCLAMATAT